MRHKCISFLVFIALLLAVAAPMAFAAEQADESHTINDQTELNLGVGGQSQESDIMPNPTPESLGTPDSQAAEAAQDTLNLPDGEAPAASKTQTILARSQSALKPPEVITG